MAGRRRFGRLRRLPSGRWQAAYTDDRGRSQSAPATFANKTDADRWLASVETDLMRGTLLNRDIGRIAFAAYAENCMQTNPKMGPRWRETCERNLRLHLAPLHSLQLHELSPAVVRNWYAAAKVSGGATSVAQSYRFLRAVLNCAVRDGAIANNPCTIPGAGSDRAAERPIATAEQIARLIAEMTPRYRAAVALAAWCGLRRGEICGLQRNDLDVDRGVVHVRRTRVELLSKGERFDALPKTPAGFRTVAVPPHILPLLEEHLRAYAGDDRLFVGRNGEPLRGDTLRQAFHRARSRAGLPQLHFHDLRHTGQTLAAAAGASMKDLMRRLGHSSSAAALRYLHASDDRDRFIADNLSKLADESTRLDRA